MRHVLIIEDQPLIARTLADMALCAGASSVAIADSEDSAIEAARVHAPRMILSDVDLKAGGRGPNAVASIRGDIGPVPTVFVTGDPDDDEARACAAAILRKPVTAMRIASVIADLLASGPDPRRRAVGPRVEGTGFH